MKVADLFTEQQKEILIRNGQLGKRTKNHVPVCRLRVPQLGYDFLITEMSAHHDNYFYGLCDYDTDISVTGFLLSEIVEKASEKNAQMFVDHDFVGKYPLLVYAKVANSFSRITVDESDTHVKGRFARFAKGKNVDPELDLNRLRWALKIV